jgi:hypothetical protein
VTITNCTFDQTIGTVILAADWETISIYNTVNAVISFNIFQRFSTINAGAIAVYGYNNNTLITNNIFNNKYGGPDISIQGSENTFIQDNNSTFSSGYFAFIKFSPSIYIIGNSITATTPGLGGFEFRDVTGLLDANTPIVPYSRDVVIENNTWTGLGNVLSLPYTGIYAGSVVAIDQVVFSNNVIVNSTTTPIHIGGPVTQSITNILISNNNIVNPPALRASSSLITVVGANNFPPMNTLTPVLENQIKTATNISLPSVTNIVPGQYIDIDAGANKETLQIILVYPTPPTITAIPLLSHTVGALLAPFYEVIANGGIQNLTICNNTVFGSVLDYPGISIQGVTDVQVVGNTFVTGSSSTPLSLSLSNNATIVTDCQCPTSTSSSSTSTSTSSASTSSPTSTPSSPGPSSSFTQTTTASSPSLTSTSTSPPNHSSASTSSSSLFVVWLGFTTSFFWLLM